MVQAALGSYTIGRLFGRRIAPGNTEVEVFTTTILLVAPALFVLVIDGRYNGEIPSAAVERAAIVLVIWFAILSFFCASHLTYLAEKIEKAGKTAIMGRLAATALITVWLAMSVASITGFTKATFFATGAAVYSLEDGEYGYLAEWKEKSSSQGAESLRACEAAVSELSGLSSDMIFVLSTQPIFSRMNGDASVFDVYVDGRLYPSLHVTRTASAARGAPPQYSERLTFNSIADGKCSGDAKSLALQDGASLPSSDVANFFGRLKANIVDNQVLASRKPFPWYALGASEALSEVNIDLIRINPINPFAKTLDSILFWVKQVLLLFVIGYCALRIKRDIYLN